MPSEFTHDVFLSHSSKDKPVVRELAARLKRDGVRVWLDEEQIKPGDSIPAKIEEGLEHSRVLVLCMSANAFGSDWAQLEAGTFRFRDPLNKDRRFIPLRLDEAPIKGSLAQFSYITFLAETREREYPRLLIACRPAGTGLVSVGVSEHHSTAAPLREPTQKQSRDCLLVWDQYEAIRDRFYERDEFLRGIRGQPVHGKGAVADVKMTGTNVEVRVRIGGTRRIGIYLYCPEEWETKLFAMHRGDIVAFGGIIQELDGIGIMLTAKSIDYVATTASESRGEQAKLPNIGEPNMIVDVTPAFLIGLYREHVTVEADVLSRPYLGKWMKISGVFDDVSKCKDGYWMVTFRKPYTILETGVFAFFRPHSIDSLRIVQRGEKIDVIGRVREIDQTAVFLDDCELVPP